MRSVVAVLLLLALSALAIGCSSLPRSAPVQTATQARAERLHTLAMQHHHAGRHDRAEVFLLQALATHAAVDHQAGVAATLSALGRVDLARGDHDAAAARFERALVAAGGVPQPEPTAEALGGLAAVALAAGDGAAAIVHLQRALALPLADPGRARAVLLHDLGVARGMAGEAGPAEASLRAALSMHEKLDDRPGIAAACYALAVFLADAGRFEPALPLAQRALQLDRAAELPVNVAQDLTLLARLAAATGQPELSSRYRQRADLAWRALGIAGRADLAGHQDDADRAPSAATVGVSKQPAID